MTRLMAVVVAAASLAMVHSGIAHAAPPAQWTMTRITITAPDGSAVTTVTVGGENTAGQLGGLATTATGAQLPFVSTGSDATIYPTTGADGTAYTIARVTDVTGAGTLVGCVVDPAVPSATLPAVITAAGVALLPLVQSGGPVGAGPARGCVLATNDAGLMVGGASVPMADGPAAAGIGWWSADGSGGTFTPQVADGYDVADLSENGWATGIHGAYLWQGTMFRANRAGVVQDLQYMPTPVQPFYLVNGNSPNGAWSVGSGNSSVPYVFQPDAPPATLPGLAGTPVDLTDDGLVASTEGYWRGCTMTTWDQMLGARTGTWTGRIAPVEVTNSNVIAAVVTDGAGTYPALITATGLKKKTLSAPTCFGTV